jgi:DNA damage-binding protein 2
MAPITRRTSFPKVVIERDSDSEQSSSDEEEQEQEILEDEENGVTENAKIEKLEVGFDANRKGKTPITLTLRKVCKVTPFL